MKYALVTGATKGIGRAIAVKLMEEGYYVFLNYAHDEEEAHNFVRMLEKSGNRRFCLLRADLSKPAGIDVVKERVAAAADGLDSVVLNAAVTDYNNFSDITWESWTKVLDTNLSIPFFLIHKLSPCLREGGSIVAIGSVMGRIPHGTSMAYGAAKAGLQFLMQELVKEFVSKQIRVNALCPGFTDTPWQKVKTEERRKRIEEKIALGRFAQPEEIADMCWAVIHNTYINGAVIDIHGGYSFS